MTEQLLQTEVTHFVGAWAVARTKSRAEKCLATFLAEREVRCFLPLLNRRHVYGARVRDYEIPLFPGYVFFDAAALPNEELFKSRRVVQVLSPPDPAQLCRELNSIALALRHDQTLRETLFGQCGDPVCVRRGKLKGLSGLLVRYGSRSRLVIQVSFLGKAVELEIDEAFVEPGR